MSNTQFKSFNRSNLEVLRKAVQEALDQVGKDLGLDLHAGRITFSPSNCSLKVEAATIGEDGEVNSKEKEDFELLAAHYDLSKEDFGKEFVSNGDKFKIAGLRPRSPKYPIIATNLKDGKTYKFRAASVVTLLKLCGKK